MAPKAGIRAAGAEAAGPLSARPLSPSPPIAGAWAVDLEATFAVSRWTVAHNGVLQSGSLTSARRWHGTMTEGEVTIQAEPEDPLLQAGAVHLRVIGPAGGSSETVAWGDGAVTLRYRLATAPGNQNR